MGHFGNEGWTAAQIILKGAFLILILSPDCNGQQSLHIPFSNPTNGENKTLTPTGNNVTVPQVKNYETTAETKLDTIHTSSSVSERYYVPVDATTFPHSTSFSPPTSVSPPSPTPATPVSKDSSNDASPHFGKGLVASDSLRHNVTIPINSGIRVDDSALQKDRKYVLPLEPWRAFGIHRKTRTEHEPTNNASSSKEYQTYDVDPSESPYSSQVLERLPAVRQEIYSNTDIPYQTTVNSDFQEDEGSFQETTTPQSSLPNAEESQKPIAIADFDQVYQPRSYYSDYSESFGVRITGMAMRGRGSRTQSRKPKKNFSEYDSEEGSIRAKSQDSTLKTNVASQQKSTYETPVGGSFDFNQGKSEFQNSKPIGDPAIPRQSDIYDRLQTNNQGNNFYPREQNFNPSSDSQKQSEYYVEGGPSPQSYVNYNPTGPLPVPESPHSRFSLPPSTQYFTSLRHDQHHADNFNQPPSPPSPSSTLPPQNEFVPNHDKTFSHYPSPPPAEAVPAVLPVSTKEQINTRHGTYFETSNYERSPNYPQVPTSNSYPSRGNTFVQYSAPPGPPRSPSPAITLDGPDVSGYQSHSKTPNYEQYPGPPPGNVHDTSSVSEYQSPYKTPNYEQYPGPPSAAVPDKSSVSEYQSPYKAPNYEQYPGPPSAAVPDKSSASGYESQPKNPNNSPPQAAIPDRRPVSGYQNNIKIHNYEQYPGSPPAVSSFQSQHSKTPDYEQYAGPAPGTIPDRTPVSGYQSNSKFPNYDQYSGPPPATAPDRAPVSGFQGDSRNPSYEQYSGPPSSTIPDRPSVSFYQSHSKTPNYEKAPNKESNFAQYPASPTFSNRPSEERREEGYEIRTKVSNHEQPPTAVQYGLPPRAPQTTISPYQSYGSDRDQTNTGYQNYARDQDYPQSPRPPASYSVPYRDDTLGQRGHPSSPQVPQQPQGTGGSHSHSGDDHHDHHSDTKWLEVYGRPGQDFPTLSRIPITSFRCSQQQHPGFYADVETNCQVFHMCFSGRQESFLCPNATIFHQKHFVCDWWQNVQCSSSESNYNLNADLYKSKKATSSSSSPPAHNTRTQYLSDRAVPYDDTQKPREPYGTYDSGVRPETQSFPKQKPNTESFSQGYRQSDYRPSQHPGFSDYSAGYNGGTRTSNEKVYQSPSETNTGFQQTPRLSHQNDYKTGTLPDSKPSYNQQSEPASIDYPNHNPNAEQEKYNPVADYGIIQGNYQGFVTNRFITNSQKPANRNTDYPSQGSDYYSAPDSKGSTQIFSGSGSSVSENISQEKGVPSLQRNIDKISEQTPSAYDTTADEYAKSGLLISSSVAHESKGPSRRPNDYSDNQKVSSQAKSFNSSLSALEKTINRSNGAIESPSSEGNESSTLLCKDKQDTSSQDQKSISGLSTENSRVSSETYGVNAQHSDGNISTFTGRETSKNDGYVLSPASGQVPSPVADAISNPTLVYQNPLEQSSESVKPLSAEPVNNPKYVQTGNRYPDIPTSFEKSKNTNLPGYSFSGYVYPYGSYPGYAQSRNDQSHVGLEPANGQQNENTKRKENRGNVSVYVSSGPGQFSIPSFQGNTNDGRRKTNSDNEHRKEDSISEPIRDKAPASYSNQHPEGDGFKPITNPYANNRRSNTEGHYAFNKEAPYRTSLAVERQVPERRQSRPENNSFDNAGLASLDSFTYQGQLTKIFSVPRPDALETAGYFEGSFVRPNANSNSKGQESGASPLFIQEKA